MSPIKIYSSADANQLNDCCLEADISLSDLRLGVETLAFPRSYRAEINENRLAAQVIKWKLDSFGYETQAVGSFFNILAFDKKLQGQDVILLGAHFDSVPECPAADDNATAVSGLLAVAKALKEIDPNHNVIFAAFNREEDGLLGSKEVVKYLNATKHFNVREVHILEMIGYASDAQNSQSLPPGINLDGANFSVGNFIGLISNISANAGLRQIMNSGRKFNLPTLGMEVNPKQISHENDLFRSDHAPFWSAGIPAIAWTDTANFRNPHYHRSTDTVETLNFEFMQKVVKTGLDVIYSRSKALTASNM